MGKFIWHMWARYVSITACVYAMWAGFWGCIFPKFFWDFIGGRFVLGGPIHNGRECAKQVLCGIIPGPNAQIFITIIVKAPVVQIITILLGLGLLLVETLPWLKPTFVHRSFVLKLVWLIFLALFSILFYQGTNAAVYSVTAAFGYAMALIKDEVMKEAKANRGRDGKA